MEKGFPQAVAGRLKTLRGEKDRRPFAAQIGVPYNQYTAYERAAKVPNAKNLAKISKATGCNLHWLLTGEGEPLPKPEHIHQPTAEYGGKIRFPVIMTVSADPFESGEGGALDHEFRELDRDTLCFEVNGDSMLPIARPGQCVLCSREQSVSDGDLAVVKLKEAGPFFKRVYNYIEEGRWLLESINPSAPQPPRLVKKDEIEFLYKVVGVLFE